MSLEKLAQSGWSQEALDKIQKCIDDQGYEVCFETAHSTPTENKNAQTIYTNDLILLPRFFIVVEQLTPEGLLVRKTYMSDKDPNFKKWQVNIPRIQKLREAYPEQFGQHGRTWTPNYAPDTMQKAVDISDHVIGDNKLTPFFSASTNYPDGADYGEKGNKKVYIDITKLEESGAQIIPTEEILKSLDAYEKENPHLQRKIATIKNFVYEDKEILIEGYAPAEAFLTNEEHQFLKQSDKVGRVLMVYSVVMTSWNLSAAAYASIKQNSLKPIAAETVKQAGGWAGAWMGSKYGATVFGELGLKSCKSGPWQVKAVCTGVSGLVGGIVGAIAGAWGAEWIDVDASEQSRESSK